MTCACGTYYIGVACCCGCGNHGRLTPPSSPALLAKAEKVVKSPPDHRSTEEWARDVAAQVSGLND